VRTKGKTDEKFSHKQKSLSVLLAQKENREEMCPFGSQCYGEAHPHHRKRGSSVQGFIGREGIFD